jgi:hypothetical protein
MQGKLFAMLMITYRSDTLPPEQSHLSKPDGFIKS